jgi:uncharacterized membrane protein YgcG
MTSLMSLPKLSLVLPVKCSKEMMKNSSISDFVASQMDAVLNSKNHQELFANTWVKKASDDSSDSSSMMVDDADARDHKQDDDSDDCSAADDGEMEVSASFDVAIDSLLTASAALDDVGMEKNSALSLRIASLVVEAKKKVKEDKKKGKMDMAKLRAMKDKKKGGASSSSKDSSKGSGKSSGKSGSSSSSAKKK